MLHIAIDAHCHVQSGAFFSCLVAIVMATVLLTLAKIELERGRQLFRFVKPIGKEDTANTTVGVDLYNKCLNVVRSVRTTREIGQVELNLVPIRVQTHGHGTNEGLHTRRRLVVGRTETTADPSIIEDLYFECKVLTKVLNDHDQERELNTKRLLRVCRARDVTCRYICPHQLEDGRRNIRITDTLNVAVADMAAPRAQGLDLHDTVTQEQHTSDQYQ